MAAQSKSQKHDPEQEAVKGRKPAKMRKDDNDEEEEMACSDADSSNDDSDDDKKGKRGKKMPWMKSKKKAKKGADDDESMDEDEDDDSDDGDMDKGFTASELERSLQLLKGLHKSEGHDARKDELFEKAHAGYRLSKSERAEMQAFIDGDAPEGEEPLSKSASAGLDDEVGATIEVTDYLEAQHRGLCKSLETLGSGVDEFKKSQDEHNSLQAQVLTAIGNAVMSLAKSQMQEEAQPARAPRARGISAPLEKSFGKPGSDTLDPATVRGALMELVQKSYESGRDGMSPRGEDLSKAVSMFESSRQLTAPVAAEVKAHLQAARLAG